MTYFLLKQNKSEGVNQILMYCDANTSRYKSRREKLSCRGLLASTLASLTSDGIWGGGGGRNKLDLGHIFLEMETFLSTDIQNKHLFLWYCSASYYDPEVVKCRFLWMLLSCCTKLDPHPLLDIFLDTPLSSRWVMKHMSMVHRKTNHSKNDTCEK